MLIKFIGCASELTERICLKMTFKHKHLVNFLKVYLVRQFNSYE